MAKINLHSESSLLLSSGFPETERKEILQLFTATPDKAIEYFFRYCLQSLLEKSSRSFLTLWDLLDLFATNHWLAAFFGVNPFNSRLPIQIMDTPEAVMMTKNDAAKVNYTIFGSQPEDQQIPVTIPIYDADYCHYKMITPFESNVDAKIAIAEDSLGFPFLIKNLRAQRTSSLIKNLLEIDCGTRLVHPYLLRFNDIVIPKECPKKKHVMLISDLHQPIKQANYSWHQLMSLISKLSSAVAFLHKNHIVHCDICPRNILADEERVVLIDFSSCRYRYSQIRHAAGTPYYFAPELYEELLEKTPSNNFSTDAWAFGLTCLEFALGRPPLAIDNYDQDHSALVANPSQFVTEILTKTSYTSSQQKLLGELLIPFFNFAKARPKMVEFSTQEMFKLYREDFETTVFEPNYYTRPPPSLIEELIALADLYDTNCSIAVLLYALDFLYSSWSVFEQELQPFLAVAFFWTSFVLAGNQNINYQDYLGRHNISNAQMIMIQEKLIWSRPYGLLTCPWIENLFTVGKCMGIYRNVILDLPNNPDLYLANSEERRNITSDFIVFRPRIVEPLKYTFHTLKTMTYYKTVFAQEKE